MIGERDGVTYKASTNLCNIERVIGNRVSGFERRSTKYSGLKFRVLHATNGTAFSGALD